MLLFEDYIYQFSALLAISMGAPKKATDSYSSTYFHAFWRLPYRLQILIIGGPIKASKIPTLRYETRDHQTDQR